MSNNDVARIHDALARMGVVRVLEALQLKGRRSGASVRLPCPVHGGNDDNCSVAVDGGRIVFHCKSRGCHGDGIALVAARRGLDLETQFGEVLAECAAIAGVGLDDVPARRGERYAAPRAVPEPDPAILAEQQRQAEGRERVLAALRELCPLEGEGLRYMTEQRGFRDVAMLHAQGVGFVSDAAKVARVLRSGFPAEVLDELGIVYTHGTLAFDAWPGSPAHPLLFFVLRGGRPTYVQGRSLDPATSKRDRWRSMRGSVPGLYCADTLEQDGPVHLCEGPIDTLSILDMRLGAAVGVIGAENFKAAWAEDLRGRDVRIALDGDDAGDAGTRKVAPILYAAGARSVRRMAVPRGYDVNGWMRAEREG